MRAPGVASLLVCAALLAPAATSLGCGSGGAPKAKTATEAQADLDGDPLALLPGDALTLGTLDAHTFFTSGSFGDDVARLTDKLVPLGDEAGFVPSRDVDHLVVATYGSQ